jgi:putative membrane protein
MSIRWLLAALHLFGLGVGLGAVWARSRALRGTLDTAGIHRVLQADTWWGIAALVWISTGLLRAFAGFEKGTTYYLHNHLFLMKMGFLLLILILEVGPIITFGAWRKQLSRGTTPDPSKALRFARTSVAQAILVLLMVIAATGMARGYGS